MSGTVAGNFWKVVRHALKTPFVLASLGVGLIVAMFEPGLAGFVIAAVAVAAAAGFVIVKLQDEDFVRRALRQEYSHRRQADLMNRTFRIEELDVEARVKMKSIVRLQGQIAEDVENSPVDEVAVGLADTVEQAEKVVDRGLSMAQKRRELLRYLRQTDQQAIAAKVQTLERKLQQEQNTEHAADTQAMLAAKQSELNDYAAIDQAAARVLEQLDSIEVALSSLRARLVRIKSTDIADWVAANDELRTELGQLNVSAESVEKTIEEVLSIGGQGDSGTR